MEIVRALPRGWKKFQGVTASGRPLRIPPKRWPYWLFAVDHVLEVAREDMSTFGAGLRFTDVAFRVVDNSTVNAKAFCDGDKGLVLLHSGLFNEVQATIERAVRNPEFLPEYLPMDRNPGSATFSFASLPPPEAEWDERTEWGVSLLKRIVDFVIHHELAHIDRSHHRLLLRPGTGLAIDEALAMHGKGRAGHRRRMLEFDADAIALDMILIEATAAPDSPLRTWTAGQTEDEVFNTLLAVIILCQLFDRRHRPMESYLIGSHPAPVLRAVRFSEVLQATFEALGKLDLGTLHDIVDTAWWEASRIATAEGFPEGRWRGDDMRDVPVALIDACRADHIAFTEEFRGILWGEEPA